MNYRDLYELEDMVGFLLDRVEVAKDVAEFALKDLLSAEETHPAFEGKPWDQMDAVSRLEGEIGAYHRVLRTADGVLGGLREVEEGESA